ncbi:unnamed protein product, partial [Trichobilharzia szidati]
MSTEAVTHAVPPVEVESSSVNTDTMTIETEVVPSPPCSSLTPAASTSQMCPQVSSERDEITSMLLNIMVTANISQAAANRILEVFRAKLPQLPTSVRSVLRMCGSCESRLLGEGMYCHIGLQKCLQHYMVESHYKTIELQLNVDGLSISKSSNQQLWPLLGRITASFLSSVFMIGIYGGPSKPSSYRELCNDLVSELKDILSQGIHITKLNRHFNVRLTAVICDAPARADVKFIVGHNASAGCDKCTVTGRKVDGRMTFGNGIFPIRTDDSFRQRMQSSHHRGQSAFEDLNIDMVKCFPLDPMHLVYLGVVRKLISLWQDLAKRKEMHVNRLMLESIDGKILDSAGMTPRDFPRKCRGLTEVSRWKATECRIFLLYLGPVLLKDTMPPAIYRNFLRLSIPVYLLSNKRFYRNYLEGCRDELLNFLNEFEFIYGREHLVYNIHCLQ